MREIETGSVDCIFTDPPYLGDMYEAAYETLALHASNVLKPGGFLLTYAPHYYLPEVMNILGGTLDYFWVVCQKNQGNANSTVFARGVMAMWKPILVYQNPPYRLPYKPFCDMIVGKRMKAHHPWEQSIHEALHLLSRVPAPGDLVLDPFAGSGTALLAAKVLGLRYIGFEIDRDTYDRAMLRLEQEPLTLEAFD